MVFTIFVSLLMKKFNSNDFDVKLFGLILDSITVNRFKDPKAPILRREF
jgi:hypothetical protein